MATHKGFKVTLVKSIFGQLKSHGLSRNWLQDPCHLESVERSRHRFGDL